MKIANSRKAAFTLLEILITTGIIGLLAAISVPNYVKSRDAAQTKTCINNLRQIDAAIQQFALEVGKANGDAVMPDDILPYMGRGAGSLANVVCPADTAKTFDTSYTLQGVGRPTLCQINPNGEHRF